MSNIDIILWSSLGVDESGNEYCDPDYRREHYGEDLFLYVFEVLLPLTFLLTRFLGLPLCLTHSSPLSALRK